MNIGDAKAGVGRSVVYTPSATATDVQASYHGSGNWVIDVAPGPPKEDGVITSVNDTYVFVRYRDDTHSKATDPRFLEFLSEGL